MTNSYICLYSAYFSIQFEVVQHMRFSHPQAFRASFTCKNAHIELMEMMNVAILIHFHSHKLIFDILFFSFQRCFYHDTSFWCGFRTFCVVNIFLKFVLFICLWFAEIVDDCWLFIENFVAFRNFHHSTTILSDGVVVRAMGWCVSFITHTIIASSLVRQHSQHDNLNLLHSKLTIPSPSPHTYNRVVHTYPYLVDCAYYCVLFYNYYHDYCYDYASF